MDTEFCSIYPYQNLFQDSILRTKKDKFIEKVLLSSLTFLGLLHSSFIVCIDNFVMFYWQTFL